MLEFWDKFSNMMKSWSDISIIARLVGAMFVGIIIGLNREMKNRGAGVKTHVLVCVGAALTMMTGEYILHQFPESKVDLTRIGAQVVSGVGFLGVGTIIVTGRNHVRGLTTAAGLWACACAGLAIGIGFFEGTTVALMIIMFTLYILDLLDREVHRKSIYHDYYIEFEDNQSVTDFLAFMRDSKIHFTNFNLSRGANKTDGPVITFTVQLPVGEPSKLFFDKLDSDEKIKFAHKL